jgi:phage gpG-like protein
MGDCLMPSRGYEVKVSVFGEEILKRRMIRFESGLIDASDALREVVKILRDATAENFATRGVSGGSRWRDLSPAYANRTGRRVNERILRLSDRLFNSLMGVGEPGAGEHVERIGPTSLRWGSRVPYGVYHGSSRPRRVIPYRPPVRLNADRKREIVKVLQAAIVSGRRSTRRAA